MLDLPWIIRHKILSRPRDPDAIAFRAARQIRGKRFVDVGACKGRYCYGLHRNFSIVHAFEPDPVYFKQLFDRQNRYWNVQLHQVALSDRNGIAPLYQPGHLPCRTLLDTFNYHPRSTQSNTVSVRGVLPLHVDVVTYDHLFHQTPVALVKIDVEGGEFLVLEGMKTALNNRMIERLQVELHDREAQGLLESVFTRYGFSFNWVDPDHIVGSL